MFQTNFSKILGPFSLPLGASAPFSNSHSHATYPQFFSHLSTSILRLRGSGGYHPQRHPYTKTYYVTPTLSSTFHKFSSLNYLIFFLQKAFKTFWTPSRCPRGSRYPFSDSPSHATYPQIFSHLSTSILRLHGSGGA